jgi:hypothetical protein
MLVFKFLSGFSEAIIHLMEMTFRSPLPNSCQAQGCWMVTLKQQFPTIRKDAGLNDK